LEQQEEGGGDLRKKGVQEGKVSGEARARLIDSGIAVKETHV